MGEGGENAAGRVHSWCAACLFGQWMAAFRHASASAAADGSLPPTPMGGGRSSPGRRRNLRPLRLSLATTQSILCRPGRYPRIFTANASTASPTRTGLRLADCHPAGDCRRTRHVVASATTGGDRLRHPARGSNPSASQHAPRAVGAASSAASAGAEFSQT